LVVGDIGNARALVKPIVMTRTLEGAPNTSELQCKSESTFVSTLDYVLRVHGFGLRANASDDVIGA